MKHLLMLVLFGASAYGADWYVDIDAAGSNNGTSWANAWTNGNAIVWSGLAAGDTVYFSDGTYDGQITAAKSGSSGSPITLRVSSDVGHTGPVIIGSPILLAGYDWIHIDGFEITETGTAFTVAAVNPGGNSGNANIGITLTNLFVHDVQNQGTKFLWAQQCVISHCIYSNILVGDCITIAGDDSVLEHSTIVEVNEDCVTIGANSNTPGTNNIVRFNRIGNPQGVVVDVGLHPDLLQFNGSGDCYGNYLFEHVSQGFWRELAHSNSVVRVYNNVIWKVPTAVNIKESPIPHFYNNTIAFADSQLFRIQGTCTAPPGGAQVVNNLFWFTNSVAPNVEAGATNLFGTWDYNLYRGDSGSTVISWGGVSRTLAAFTSASGFDANGVVTLTDSFAESGAGNMQLVSGSAAIGAGFDLSSYFTTDFTPSTRVAPWEIGAYEYLGRRATAGTVNVGTLTIGN